MIHSDNLNGTFTNPMILADYPDPDIIRVGDDFYMVSSSFHLAPGVPVCHSRDLINWRIIGYAYDRLPAGNPKYDLQDGQYAYRSGSWAPCIRYHHNKFHIGFNTPDEGFFVAISEKPEGPYELTRLNTVLYDPGLFFDDDGRAYVIHAAVGISVTELTPDCRAVKKKAQLIYQSAFGQPCEGSHAYKRNGFYYVCVTARGYNGIELCLRSRSIYGPYECRVISGDDMNYGGSGLHQGGFVELKSGETWFFMFQDRDYVGRVPVLQPVRWVDDWPELGDRSNFGKAVVTCRKPDTGHTSPAPRPESDDFDAPELGLQWQWSHNPVDANWSLTEHQGFLRLKAMPAADFLHAHNTLTQRIVGGGCFAVCKLDAANLRPGDIAGLAVANIPYCQIGVFRGADGYRVRRIANQELQADLPAPAGATAFYFRIEADVSGLAHFSFGTDGETFATVGEPFRMEFTVKTFLGNRFGLYCYGDGGGYADFDWLRREEGRIANLYCAFSATDFSSYDYEYGTDTHRLVAKEPKQHLISIDDGDYVVFDQLDFGDGADGLRVRASAVWGGVIEIREDSRNGRLVGTCEIPDIGNHNEWGDHFRHYECPTELLTGRRRICFVFRGERLCLFRLDCFQFYSDRKKGGVL